MSAPNGAVVYNSKGEPVGVVSSQNVNPTGPNTVTVKIDGSVRTGPPTVPPGRGSASSADYSRLELYLTQAKEAYEKASKEREEFRIQNTELRAGMWANCFPQLEHNGVQMISVPEPLLHALLRLTEGASVDRHDLMVNPNEEIVMFEHKDPFTISMKLREKRP